MLLIYTPEIGRDRTPEEWAAMVRRTTSTASSIDDAAKAAARIPAATHGGSVEVVPFLQM